MRRNVRSVVATALLVMLAAVTAVVRDVRAEPAPVDPVEEALRKRNAALDSLLNPNSLDRDTAGLYEKLPTWDASADSLFKDYPDFGKERRIHFSCTPLSFSTYNRVEGQRFGIATRLTDQKWFDVSTAAGYALKAHRWSGFGRVTLGEPVGPAVRLEGFDRTVPFGPNRVEYAAGFLSLVAGQDRQDYLRTRGGTVTLWPWRSPDYSAWVAASHHEDLPVPARKDWSLFGGGTPMEEPNPEIDRGRTNSVSLGGSASFQHDLVEVTAEAGVSGGGLGGDFDYSWQSGRGTIRPIFPDGGTLSLSVEGARVGGDPPVQAVPYLGGDGNLRGYGRLQFAGRSRVSARVEYATGLDLLNRSRLPIVKALHLQFIPFADLGSTWEKIRAVDKTEKSLEGDIRSSVGLGIRREMWIPGVQAVRLDIIRRTDGSEKPWGFWFRILSLQ